MEGMTTCLSELAHSIIGAAIEVHRALGPGLLESAYLKCLDKELRFLGLKVACEVEVPVIYRGELIGCHYRLDLLVEDAILIEVKSVEHLLPVHSAQVLTYLKLTGLKKALLLNFNVPVLKAGLRSFVN